jgi:pilus assembly protein CpaC
VGALFRSVDYRRDESELLVVVTARLAKPLAPHELPPLPTEDEMNDPTDFGLFLLGSEDRSAPPKESREGAKRASLERRGPSGEIGFIR